MIVHLAPQYSQYLHIPDKKWQDKSCGIVSLAMLAHHFQRQIPIAQLLETGLAQGAYLSGIGWTHRGLVQIAQRYGFNGTHFDWNKENPRVALRNVQDCLLHYPILASMYRYPERKQGGHLVLLTGFNEYGIFYNDPNTTTKTEIAKFISYNAFSEAWKKRVVVIRPPQT